MNTTARPTRVPPPPSEHYDVEQFETAAPTNNLPAERPAAVQAPSMVSEHIEPEPAPLPVTPFGNLAGAIASVMAELKPVEKGGWNKFQSYAYARIQDLMAALTPLMGKHGIVVFQNEEGREMFDDGKAIAVRYRFTIVHRSGEVWPQQILQTGLSSCRNSKDGFDDKSLNKCHTAARKYFLLSLFQIPTEDAEDADASGQPQRQVQTGPRPKGRRPVPGPDGRIAPHTIAIIDGESPSAWGARFLALVRKAATKADIDGWYNENAGAFEKLEGRFPDEYAAIIDEMDAHEASLSAKAPEKPAGEPKPDAVATASNSPADKPAAAAGDPGPIPAALRRTKPPVLSPDEREWIEGLEGVFSGCDDIEGLNEAFQQFLGPKVAVYSTLAVEKATKLYNDQADKIEKGA